MLSRLFSQRETLKEKRIEEPATFKPPAWLLEEIQMLETISREAIKKACPVYYTAQEIEQVINIIGERQWICSKL